MPKCTGVPEFDAIYLDLARSLLYPALKALAAVFSTPYKKSGAVGPRFVIQYSGCKRLAATKHYLAKHSRAILLIQYIWDTDITILCAKLLKRHEDFSTLTKIMAEKPEFRQFHFVLDNYHFYLENIFLLLKVVYALKCQQREAMRPLVYLK